MQLKNITRHDIVSDYNQIKCTRRTLSTNPEKFTPEPKQIGLPVPVAETTWNFVNNMQIKLDQLALRRTIK